MELLVYLYGFMAFGFCFQAGVFAANTFIDIIRDILDKMFKKNS